MARCFAKVLEEEIEEAFFHPSDLVNTKTTIPLRVGEGRGIYTSTLRVSVYIYHYSPPLRAVSYTHLRAHETDSYLVCRLLLEKKTPEKTPNIREMRQF